SSWSIVYSFYVSLTLFIFFFQSSAPHPDLHSFPTRRSSDLVIRFGRLGWRDAEDRGAVSILGRRRDAHAILVRPLHDRLVRRARDRKSTRLNSSHDQISYAVFCLKKKKTKK